MVKTKKGIVGDTQAPLFVYIIIFLLIIFLLFEGIILLVGYIFADEIKCTWLWCEFTIKKGKEVYSRECYINKVRVNCSEIPDKEYISAEEDMRK